MPHATIKLTPGIDTNTTLALNQAAYSQSQLIRFLPERNNYGLAQKLGGWVSYYSGIIGSIVRALKGWSDLNGNTRLGIGALSSLSTLSNGSLINITPYALNTNNTPNFSTIAGSTTVTIVDAGINSTNNDYVNYVTPVSVGGIVLSGPYQIQTAAGTTYIITAASAATSTVSSGGLSYAFSTLSGTSTITTTFANHGLLVGNTIYVGVSTSIGGITLFGLYTVLAVTSANSFTFAAATTATSTAGPISINGGNISAQYYIAVGSQALGTGYGVGGYGVGGYGVGTVQPSISGSQITTTDWTLDNFGAYLVACPAGGAIYYWNPTGQLTTATFLGGSAPLVSSGIFIAMPQRQIIAYGSSFTLSPDPLLIRWCDVGDFTNWVASPVNQAGSYRIPTGSTIVCGLQGPQQGILWTDVDVWSMQYVGFPLVYGFNKIASNCGAISRHCMGQIEGNIYWMSQKQFYVLSGTGVAPVSCPVWDIIFQNINTTYLYKVCCAVNSQFNEISWYYPSLSSTGENDSYVKFNIVLQQWDYGLLGRSAWIDQSVLGSPIGAGTDQYIYQHEVGNDAASGTMTVAMQSSFQTGYIQLNEADQMIFIDQIWPDMKWGTYNGSSNATVSITFNAVNYPGDTPIVYGPYIMTQQTEYISVRIRARLLSIAVSSNDTGTFWRLGAIRYRYQTDGRF